jgi:hypothetical protein
MGQAVSPNAAYFLWGQRFGAAAELLLGVVHDQ